MSLIVAVTNLRLLGIGKRVLVKVYHTDNKRYINFNFCDGKKCKVVAIRGATPEGALRSISFSNCNELGLRCSKEFTQVRGIRDMR